jgi:hypothetical protein
MLYNRLVTNRHRAEYLAYSGVPFMENRCSGRSTAIALEAVAKAIKTPQEWVAVVDHYERARPIDHVNLARQAMGIAEFLNLQFFERDQNMIRSCHMTTNQLELK